MFDRPSARTTQRGAILITTLVFLMILTLYGVTSARDAKTQLLIASNNQLQSISLSAAEGALTRVENTVKCLRDRFGPVVAGAGDGLNDGVGLEKGDSITKGQLQGTDACYDENDTNANYLSPRDFDFDGDGVDDNLFTVTLSQLSKICPETADGETAVEVFTIIVDNSQSRGARRRLQSVFQVLSTQLDCP